MKDATAHIFFLVPFSVATVCLLSSYFTPSSPELVQKGSPVIAGKTHFSCIIEEEFMTQRHFYFKPIH